MFASVYKISISELSTHGQKYFVETVEVWNSAHGVSYYRRPVTCNVPPSKLYMYECFSELKFSIQDIFVDYKQPFAVTYLGASLMVVYLPVAFIKDWLYKLFKHCSSKSGRSAKVGDDFSVTCTSPLKGNGVQKTTEVELGSMTRKDSDANLSVQEQVKPLVAKYNDATAIKAEKELTTREIATYGFYIAPIWFITEVRKLRLISQFCS